MRSARVSRTGGQPGFPPLAIEPASQLNADRVSVRGDVSSQFLTGLLMAAPLIAPAHGLRISVDGPLISRPYVEMTLALMRRFGVDVARDGDSFLVPRAPYDRPVAWSSRAMPPERPTFSRSARSLAVRSVCWA